MFSLKCSFQENSLDVTFNTVLFFLAFMPLGLYQQIVNIFEAPVKIIMIQIFLVSILLLRCKKISISVFSSRTFLLLIYFVLICFFSSIYYFNDLNNYNLVKLKSLIVISINILLMSIVPISDREIRGLISLIKAYSVFVAIIALLFYQIDNSRLVLASMNPIWLSRCILPGIIIICMDFFSSGRINITSLVAMIIIGWCAFLTKSFGPIVALLVAMIIILYENYVRSVKRYDWHSLICALLTFVGLFLFIIWDFIDLDFSASFYYRKVMFEYVLDLNNISLTGIGFGNFYDLGFMASRFNYPHNVLIEAVLELGLIGGALLLLYFVRVFAMVKNYWSTNLKILWALAIYSVLLAMFSGDLTSGNLYMYLFPILVIKISYLQDNSDQFLSRK